VAANQGDGKESAKVADRVIKLLNRRFKKEEVPTIEQIQDIVEESLILEDLVDTAKAYILYREQRRAIREAAKVSDESSEKIDSYLKEIDWQVKENANMTFSLQGLNQYVGSYISKKYWLNKIYPKEIRDAAANEDFHIHNLELFGAILRRLGSVRLFGEGLWRSVRQNRMQAPKTF
jgi:ribonucleoside-triphosphate reductase